MDVVAAGEVHEPGKSLGDKLAESRAAAFVRAIGNDQVGLACLTEDLREGFLRFDVVTTNEAIPSPVSEEGGFGIIVSQTLVGRIDLQDEPHVRMTLVERLNNLDRAVFRGVVYHDNLEAYPGLAACCYHRLQRLLDVRFLVVTGNKNSQLNFFFCHSVTYSNSLTLPRIRRLIPKITLAMGTNRA